MLVLCHWSPLTVGASLVGSLWYTAWVRAGRPLLPREHRRWQGAMGRPLGDLEGGNPWSPAFTGVTRAVTFTSMGRARARGQSE
jgi:hypothetical protein